jgi:hypothetical protein
VGEGASRFGGPPAHVVFGSSGRPPVFAPGVFVAGGGVNPVGDSLGQIQVVNARTSGVPSLPLQFGEPQPAAAKIAALIASSLFQGGLNEGTLYFPPGFYGLEQDLVIPDGVHLWMANGAKFEPVEAGGTLTINGGLTASDTQIFIPQTNFGVPSTLAVRFNSRVDVVNPFWFGARADGVTDDTGAAQAAINAAGDNTIVLFNRFHRVTNTLSVIGKHRLTLLCEGGKGGFLASAPTFDLVSIDTTSDHITIDGLTFVGVSVANETRAAVRSAAGYTTIRHCEASGLNSGFLFSTGNWYAGFEHCIATENYIHDLVGALSGNGYGVYTDCPNTIVSNNRFKNVPRHDVYCSGSDLGANYTVVEGNSSIGNGFQAIAVFNTAGFAPIKGVVVKGNTIRDCNIGIRCDVNARATAIVGNGVENAAASAIQMDGGVLANEQPNGNVVVGNTITNCQFDQPILVTNASRTIIAFNFVESAGKLYGIFITSAGAPAEFPTGTQVFGNVLVGMTTWSVFVDATCIDTVVGPNYSSVPELLGNDRDVIIVTSSATPVTVDLKGKGSGRDIMIFFNQAGAIVVTNFLNAREGQVIRLIFAAGQVTITNANAFFAGGAASFISTGNDVLKLLKHGANWFEESRSIN